MKIGYYVDTCIWLNIFKKEGDETKGVPYWKSGKDFIELIEKRNEKIIVSTIILKELYFTSEKKFDDIKKYFKNTEFIQIIKTENEDYELARKFEKEHQLLSFYDYLHVTIAKRLHLILVTRDKDLIAFANDQVEVHKPEDLLC